MSGSKSLAKSLPSSDVSGLDDAEQFDAQLATRVCWHYFKEGRTQEEVAQRLGLNRKRVNQLVGQALAAGLVQISIDGRFGPYLDLEARLADRYGLRRAVVVPSPAPETDVRLVVGAAAGQYISDALADGETLAIAWGGTLHAAAQNLRRRQGGNTVISLVGGLVASGPINPYDNAAMFARFLGAHCRYVTAPMIAETPALRDAIMASRQIRETFAAVRNADRAVLTAIDLTEQSRALEYGVISRATWQSLRRSGAVGDIAGHYLDADGRAVDHPITHQVICAELADLRSVRDLVLAAGGAHKAPIIRAGLKARLCHVLITDAAAAVELLT
jgi:DNA-binding transcriptional regulator LsrR (DeoR family)